jgi:NitT/TauT family transport system ATP-binding protein
VRRGETFAIVGPSGCGKTTLLKAIAGFIHPTRGTLAIDGELAPEPGPDRAVVFQDFDQLFAWRTIRSNITYALRVARGIRDAAARSRADAMLALVDIARAAESYPHELSGGMKQRAAIARALALEPALLLMDEPFGALDAITRAQLQLELRKIKATTAVTIVIVTHSIEEAIFLGDRVMVMSSHPARIREIVDTESIADFEAPGFAEAVLRLRDLLVTAPA